MILTRKLALTVAAVAAAGVLVTAGVAAAAANGTPSATATAPAGSSSTPAGSPTPDGTVDPDDGGPRGTAGRHHGTGWHGRHGRLARVALTRGLHGEWVVKGKDGTPVTLVSVRGTVTAVGSASLTLKAEDGYTATFTTDADTRLRGADVDSLSDVTVGSKAAAVGVKDGTAVVARVILVRT